MSLSDSSDSLLPGTLLSKSKVGHLLLSPPSLSLPNLQHLLPMSAWHAPPGVWPCLASLLLLSLGHLSHS